MERSYYLVDVFAEQRFGGNQLAVFLNPGRLSPVTMQAIARELNLSETTFVFPPSAPTKDRRLRIFTPRNELPMAGHPTIGTAYVLLAQGYVGNGGSGTLVFEEGVGDVAVDYEISDGVPGLITMHQRPPRFGPKYEDGKRLAEMLSLATDEVSAASPAQVVDCGVPILVVRLRDLEAARAARLRMDLWERYLKDFESRELMVFTTETQSPEATAHARFFAPGIGVPEDPATGAASGPLGCYLTRYVYSDRDDDVSVVSEQGIEMGRQSTIRIDVSRRRGEITSVRVSGRTVMVGRGTLFVD